MKVCGKQNIEIMLFQDLDRGDVFYFSSDNGKEDKKIWMRCGHSDTDLAAVNLESGVCYSFAGCETVVQLQGEFSIEGIMTHYEI